MAEIEEETVIINGVPFKQDEIKTILLWAYVRLNDVIKKEELKRGRKTKQYYLALKVEKACAMRSDNILKLEEGD